MGRQVELSQPPQRIISLVPSQTELLADMGLTNRLVGITKFCVHPPELKIKCTVIGGTKNLHLDRIHSLKPDLIIGNKEENEKSVIEELQLHYPLWMSDIHDLSQALEMMTAVGHVCQVEENASQLTREIQLEFDTLQPFKRPLKVAYLIWQKPFMGAGANTFIHNMLTRLGWKNVLENLPGRYPEFSPEFLLNANPDLVLLSSEPYPFAEQHCMEWKQRLPQTQVLLADGEMFSWYGSRLRFSPAYFRELMSRIG